jgi:hypothetical protein
MREYRMKSSDPDQNDKVVLADDADGAIGEFQRIWPTDNATYLAHHMEISVKLDAWRHVWQPARKVSEKLGGTQRA